MSDTPTLPAFPIHPGSIYESYCDGLSMRDYFAAKAMQSLVTRIPNVASKKEGQKMIEEIADAAYFFADAMMIAREAK